MVEYIKIYKILKEVFADYKGMLCEYAQLSLANIDTKDVALKICNLNETHQIMFADYITSRWEEYTKAIINGKYKYIHLTQMVYDSWVEYMKERKENGNGN